MIRRAGSSIETRIAAFAASIAVSAAIAFYFYYAAGLRPLYKWPPDWSGAGLWRTVACLTAAVLFCIAIRPSGERRELFETPADRIGFQLLFLSSFALLALTAAITAISPPLLFAFARENALAENASTALLAGCAVVTAAGALRCRGSAAGRLGPFSPSPALWLMAAAAFIVLMEEISWGQQVLKFATPAAFEGNLQNETNLHNFYTHRFELLYYSAAVLLFVFLPYAWPARVPPLLGQLSFYAPSRHFALGGATLCGYMFETWNIVPFQVCFFCGMLILLLQVFEKRAPAAQIGAAGAMFVLLAVSQAIFLAKGNGFVRAHDLSEIKELQIALMMFAYAVWLVRRLEQARKP